MTAPSSTFNAAELQFGEHFTFPRSMALSNAEVASIYKTRYAQFEKIQSENPSANLHLPSNFLAVMNYADTFAPEPVKRNLPLLHTLQGSLIQKRFDPFEIACMFNFLPDDYDEALALLPSLGRFDQHEVEDALQDIAKVATS
ncbi:hypothetical protein RCL1_001434 [Eukaryota sp. TZLM3-RCL]